MNVCMYAMYVCMYVCMCMCVEFYPKRKYLDSRRNQDLEFKAEDKTKT